VLESPIPAVFLIAGKYAWLAGWERDGETRRLCPIEPGPQVTLEVQEFSRDSAVPPLLRIRLRRGITYLVAVVPREDL
jgi:hypothetical protein